MVGPASGKSTWQHILVQYSYSTRTVRALQKGSSPAAARAIGKHVSPRSTAVAVRFSLPIKMSSTNINPALPERKRDDASRETTVKSKSQKCYENHGRQNGYVLRSWPSGAHVSILFTLDLVRTHRLTSSRNLYNAHRGKPTLPLPDPATEIETRMA